MRKHFGRVTKKGAILICVNGLMLIAVIVLCITFGKLKSCLPSRRLADKWSAGESYSQVSVFFADSVELDLDRLNATIDRFEKKLDEVLEQSTESVEAGFWTYGYSSDSSLFVMREAVVVEAAVTGVGEDFFMFHPLRLVSGSYIYGSDLMRDRVVIDSELAWQLFGATDVAGMAIEMGGLPYIIAGVVAPEMILPAPPPTATSPEYICLMRGFF